MTVHGNFFNATAQTTPQLTVDVNLYDQSTLTVSGDLVNNGDFTAWSSQLTVSGRLRNSGDVTIEYGGAYHVANDATNSNYIRVSEINTVLQIDGSMDNTGRLHASNGGKISIGGTLVQQVNEVLTAGALAVGEDGSIEWSGASIKTVAKGASLQIFKGGRFLNKLTGANALAALAENKGQIELDSGGSIVTTGDFLMQAHSWAIIAEPPIPSGSAVTLPIREPITMPEAMFPARDRPGSWGDSSTMGVFPSARARREIFKAR